MNGFANGYIMPAGQHSVRLSFGPQRLFVSGVAVSTVTLALAFLTTLGLVRRSCGSDRSEVKISSRSEKLLRPDLPPGQA